MKSDLSLIRRAADGLGQSVEGLEIDFKEREDGVLVVAIAGSDLEGRRPFRDYRRSLDFLPFRHPCENRGYCHPGYYQIGSTLIHETFQRVSGRRLKVVGYSMGGPGAESYAQLCHDVLELEVVEVVTYGAPRWLSKRFRWPPEIPRTRVVCGSDPVPWLWPWFHHQIDAEKVASPNKKSTWPRRAFLDHDLRSYQLACI